MRCFNFNPTPNWGAKLLITSYHTNKFEYYFDKKDLKYTVAVDYKGKKGLGQISQPFDIVCLHDY